VAGIILATVVVSWAAVSGAFALLVGRVIRYRDARA
jgi:hypothetical protein